MSPDALSNLYSLVLGFALAGALASGYQAAAARPAGFGMLAQEARARALLAVPLLVFAAPFIIMRNILTDTRAHPRRIAFVACATIVAGFWSMMSGTALVMLLQAMGLLA